MHEISLVQGLFSQLNELAAENSMSKIISVTMEIGPLSGVVVDSFQFGFDILSTDDEIIKGAKLIIQVPEVIYNCTSCHHTMVSTERKHDGCSECGELLLIPNGGDDLMLLQVEME